MQQEEKRKKNSLYSSVHVNVAPKPDTHYLRTDFDLKLANTVVRSFIFFILILLRCATM